MLHFYKKLFLISSLIFFFFQSNATHIVGGEMYYNYIGNNRYAIQLRVYRDCWNGIPPFDNPASIGVFDINNNLILQQCVSLFSVNVDTIPPTITSPCFIPPIDVCYQKAIYYDTITLPPLAGGYQFSYQRCCRNQTILNIISPLDVGITVYAHTPTDTSNLIDGNPVFKNLPPTFICLGLPFVWDFSAIDPNADSLSYELCIPFEGGQGVNNSTCDPNQQDPGCGNGLWTCGPQPHPPFNPPYTNVQWQAPFSLANLLGGTPMTIDPVTGILTATPNTIGQFVYAVCVNEYRNGIWIGKTRRDFQVNVVPCPSLVVAALQNPIILCGDSTVLFQNQSIGASTYSWNFGDLTTLADTSHSINPSYSYPDTGAYTVTLIAYSTFNAGCADTTTGIVHIYPPFNADFSFKDSLCTYLISFTDSSTNTGSGFTSLWNWKYGDAGISSVHNPIHNYPGPGTFNVTFIATSNKGCRDTVIKQVHVDSLVTATFLVNQPVKCNGDCNGSATVIPKSGTAPYTFHWNTSTNDTTATVINLCAGTYSVTVTDSNGCTVTKNVTLSNPAVLTTTHSHTDAYCEGKCIGSASVNAFGGTPPYVYSWNPNGETTQSISNLCQGDYSVLITDAHGCTGADSIHVSYSNYIPPVDASVNMDTIYEGQSVQFNSTFYLNTIYNWTPPVNLNNSGIYNPTGIFMNEGSYVYVVTINDSLGCANKDSVRIFVKKTICIEPEIFIPNAFTPNNDGANDILYVRGNAIKELLFRVYDRWGEKVFETTLAGTGWDGTFKGQPVQPGVYDYYLEATCFNNEKFFKKGNVTVLK